MLRLFHSLLLVLLVCASCHTYKQDSPPSQVHKTVAKEATGVAHAPLSYEVQRRYDKLFLEAVRQKEAGRVDAQHELLEEALKLNPTASEAVYEMALIKLSYSSYMDSLARAQGDSLLHAAVRLDPGNLYYKENLGTFLANSAKYREAIRLYEDIADQHQTYETLANLIWLYKTSGDYAGAIRTIERLEELDGKSEQLSLEKFQTHLAMKDDEHAYQAIEELCAEYPLDLRYRVLLGDLYDQQGYHQQALDIYRDVLTAEPDNSYAQLSLLAYYKAAQADSLYLDLLSRVVLNPNTKQMARIEAMRSYAVDNLRANADSTPVLQLFHRALSQPQESRDMAELMVSYVVGRHMPPDTVMAALDAVLRIEPDYTVARLQKLQVMISRGDIEGIAEVCHEGELYDPAEVTFYYYEGSALYMLGKNTEAMHSLQRGTERVNESTDPQTASDIYALLGDVLHGSSLKEDAYLAYDHALQYNPLNALCLNNYAYFLALDNRELERAENMSRKAVEIEDDNHTYLDTYAWVLYCRKQYTQARIYMDEALRYARDNEEFATYYDHAGDIYYHTGERTKALAFWKKALALTTDKNLKRKIQRKVWRKRP